MDLGKVGIWTRALDDIPWSEAADLVAEIEELGFPTLWIPEALSRDPLIGATLALGASTRLRLATGVVNLHMREPLALAIAQRSIVDAYGDRFVLGVGVSHRPMVEGMLGKDYGKPLAATRAYLEAMDAASSRLPRLLAALGPRMLALAADLADGAHPYFAPAGHTAIAREALGTGPVLAPEVAVVLTDDADAARELAREHMVGPLAMENYRRNLLRSGLTEADLDPGPSDRAVDAIVAWGTPERIAERVAEHHDAGADHVCIHVLGDRPLQAWRELAPALLP